MGNFKRVYVATLLIALLLYSKCKFDALTEKPDHCNCQVKADPTQLSTCPDISPLLKGDINVTLADSDAENWPPSFEEIAVRYSELELGGFYPGPSDCKTKYKLLIIIPYRNRDEHLRYLLHYIHGILQRQQVSYTIYVVEQDDEETFNKGQLMNTGFQYAMNQLAMNDVNCVFFHDVDIISEDDRTLYRCVDEKKVVHLSHQIDKYNYVFCCGINVGGVLGFKPKQFKKINGFSNKFYGWGGEDDDVESRITNVGKYEIYRPQKDYAKFKMIPHDQDNGNPDNSERFKLLETGESRQATDGINSLPTQINGVRRFKTHTRILVKTLTRQSGIH